MRIRLNVAMNDPHYKWKCRNVMLIVHKTQSLIPNRNEKWFNDYFAYVLHFYQMPVLSFSVQRHMRNMY